MYQIAIKSWAHAMKPNRGGGGLLCALTLPLSRPAVLVYERVDLPGRQIKGVIDGGWVPGAQDDCSF